MIKNNTHIVLKEMQEEEAAEVVDIISKAMNKNEGRCAKDTIRFHFFAKKNNIDDGRGYFVSKLGKKIIGVVGLHHYIWGPKEITWLGWFAVEPKCQGRGIGTYMMKKICKIAKEKGYKKLLIETYSADDFKKARGFYEKVGFKGIGRIKDYLGKNKDMLVYGRNLN